MGWVSEVRSLGPSGTANAASRTPNTASVRANHGPGVREPRKGRPGACAAERRPRVISVTIAYLAGVHDDGEG